MKLGLTRQYIRTTRLSGNCLGQSMWLHVPEEEKEKKKKHEYSRARVPYHSVVELLQPHKSGYW